jgi:protein O-mannosyl-transferase
VPSESDTVADRPASVAPDEASRARRRLLARPELGLGLLLVALTGCVYGRAVRFDFLIFDEPAYVTDNFYVLSGLSLPGIRWAVRTVHDSNWIPLTWLSLMLDATLYGRWAGGFHATNLLLHAANVLLVFAFFTQATGRTLRSAFVAALFAVHPLHVESVVWIAERKDVLSVFFGLVSLCAYVRYAQCAGPKRIAWWAAAFVALAFSLASKQTLVTLPFIFLLLDFWPLGRWSGAVRPERPEPDDTRPDRPAGLARLVAEKIPFFILSAAFCGVALWAQSRGHAVRSLVEMPLAVRAENAIVAYALYLERAFVPVGLAIFYPHPGLGIGIAGVALAGTVLLTLTVAAVVNARRWPFVLVGWLWFLGTLVPMIGLVQIGFQQMADRYAYFPNLGLYLAVAWLVPALVPSAAMRRRMLPPLAGGLVATGAALAFVQVGYWRDGLTLMRHSLAETGESAFGCTMLGDALRGAGCDDEARAQYQRTIELAPTQALGHLSLGVEFNDQGQFAAAAEQYRAAIAVDEHSAQAHSGLAMALCGQQNFADARAEFERTLELDSKNLAAYAGLALLCRTLGEFEQSNDYAERALAIDDAYLHCQRLRAIQLFDQGRLEEAVERLRRLLVLAPHLGDVRMDLEQARAAQRERAASLLR